GPGPHDLDALLALVGAFPPGVAALVVLANRYHAASVLTPGLSRLARRGAKEILPRERPRAPAVRHRPAGARDAPAKTPSAIIRSRRRCAPSSLVWTRSTNASSGSTARL